MKFSIIKESYNPFLKRKEIEIDLDHTSESTPSKAALEVVVAKELGVNVENIDIKNIFSRTGSSTARSKIFVLDIAKPKEVKPEENKEKSEEGK